MPSAGGGQLPYFNPGQRRRLKGSGHCCVLPNLRKSEPKLPQREQADVRVLGITPAIASYPLSCNDQRSCGTEPSAAGEARIDAVSIWQNLVAHFEQLERHLLDEILLFANLTQIPPSS